MNLTFLPNFFRALATKSTVMISLKLPMCTTPLGVIPAATVYSGRSPLASTIFFATLSGHCSFRDGSSAFCPSTFFIVIEETLLFCVSGSLSFSPSFFCFSRSFPFWSSFLLFFSRKGKRLQEKEKGCFSVHKLRQQN